jgi:hypothetical protein
MSKARRCCAALWGPRKVRRPRFTSPAPAGSVSADAAVSGVLLSYTRAHGAHSGGRQPPIVGSFSGCCARAANGHAATPLTDLIKSRRRTGIPKAWNHYSPLHHDLARAAPLAAAWWVRDRSTAEQVLVAIGEWHPETVEGPPGRSRPPPRVSVWLCPTMRLSCSECGLRSAGWTGSSRARRITVT